MMVCTIYSARLNALCLSRICLLIYHRIWKVLFCIRPLTHFLIRQNAHQDPKTPMKLKTSHRRKGIEPSPSREDSSHSTTVPGCCHSAKGRSAHFAFFGPPAREKSWSAITSMKLGRLMSWKTLIPKTCLSAGSQRASPSFDASAQLEQFLSRHEISQNWISKMCHFPGQFKEFLCLQNLNR